MNFPLQNFPASFRLDQPEQIPSSLDDTDDSTRKTVEAMCRHIAKAQSDPWFLSIAHGITESSDLADKVSGAFLLCKAAIKFKRDEESAWTLCKKINAIDFLIEPRVQARIMQSPSILGRKMAMTTRAEGDCDEFTMFSLACLKALGLNSEIVTVAVDPERPGYWSHVYGQVILPDGRRMALDCSPAGKFPGWEVPDRDVQRKQAWALDGSMSYSTPASKDLGLHAYIPRRRANRGRRGVGDDTLGMVADPVTPDSWFAANFDTPLSIDPTTGARTGGTFNWNSLLQNLTKVGGNLATIALTPKGAAVRTDANGNLIVSNTGLPASFASLTSGGGSSLLLWGGIALAVLLVAKAASK